MSKYEEEITKTMEYLAGDPRVIFLGQSICYPGHIMTGTLKNIPLSKKIELPVTEEMQLGISAGLALRGYVPVSIYPRMDFMMRCMDQLVNHLDKMKQMSCGRFNPRVIIRTMVGSIRPMFSGPQHIQDHTEAFRAMLTNIRVVKLTRAEDIMPAYRAALTDDRSTILIEAPPYRAGYDDPPTSEARAVSKSPDVTIDVPTPTPLNEPVAIT